MERYNIGDVWWIHFPFSDKDEVKRRPAIVIDDKTIAILAMYVTTKKHQNNPYIRSTNNNKADIDDYASELLAKEVVTEYVTCAKHCKYSVSDEV